MGGGCSLLSAGSQPDEVGDGVQMLCHNPTCQGAGRLMLLCSCHRVGYCGVRCQQQDEPHWQECFALYGPTQDAVLPPTRLWVDNDRSGPRARDKDSGDGPGKPLLEEQLHRLELTNLLRQQELRRERLRQQQPSSTSASAAFSPRQQARREQGSSPNTRSVSRSKEDCRVCALTDSCYEHGSPQQTLTVASSPVEGSTTTHVARRTLSAADAIETSRLATEVAKAMEQFKDREAPLRKLHNIILTYQQSVHDAFQRLQTLGALIEDARFLELVSCVNRDAANDPVSELCGSVAQLMTIESASLRGQLQHMRANDLNTVAIGDFDILRLVARGGCSRVYVARKVTSESLYALKVVRKRDVRRLRIYNCIWSERQILQEVGISRYVTPLVFAFQSPDSLFFALELQPGLDISYRISSLGRIPEKDVQRYAAQIVLSLQFLHGMGVTHRDLKPTNILIGADGHLKLCDFGLSCHDSAGHGLGAQGEHDDTLSALSLNLAGGPGHYSRVGTVVYVAPEIYDGVGYDFRVDWWSLGIIIYEMLSGARPFHGASDVDVMSNAVKGVREWPDAIPQSARSLILGLLTVDPAKRLGTLGARQILAHEFFSGLCFESLYDSPGSFVPSSHDLFSMAANVNDSAEADNNDCASTSSGDTGDGGSRDDYQNFAYVNQEYLAKSGAASQPSADPTDEEEVRGVELA